LFFLFFAHFRAESVAKKATASPRGASHVKDQSKEKITFQHHLFRCCVRLGRMAVLQVFAVSVAEKITVFRRGASHVKDQSKEKIMFQQHLIRCCVRLGRMAVLLVFAVSALKTITRTTKD